MCKKNNKVVFNDEEMAMLAMANGPFWKDYCEHEEGSYITSFQIYNHRTRNLDSYDLYVFPNGAENDKHDEICIRYGTEPERYISPGTLGHFLMQAGGQNDIYRTAARILLHFGKISWVKN